jgi:hypothetical protein
MTYRLKWLNERDEPKIEIQSIYFSKHWSKYQTAKWLVNNGIIPMKEAHITPGYIRYRIQDPKLFKRFKTVKLGDGINIVYGFIK